MKKLVSLFLALMMLVSMMGIASAEEPVTLTFLYPWSGAIESTDQLIDPESPNYDARWPEVLEKLNLRIEYVLSDFSTGAEQIRVNAASGMLPDVNMNVGLQARELVQYAEEDMVYALDPTVLAQYPNIQRNLDSINGLEAFMTSDGKLAAIPSSMDLNGISGDYTYMLIYRKDMALAAGCEIKDAYTVEELFDMYKKVQEAYPEFALAAHVWPEQTYQWGLYQYCPYFSNVPNQNFYYNEEAGKYVYAPADENTLEGILWTKKFYDAGILGVDYLNMPAYDANTMFLGGTLFSYWYGANCSFLESIISSFYANNPDAPEGAVDVLLLKDKDGRYMNVEGSNEAGQFFFAPNISEEKLTTALKMFDYLMSDEGIERCFYGLEGVNFTRDENGKLHTIYREDGKKNTVSIALICRALVPEVSIAHNNPHVSDFCKERIDYLFKLRTTDNPFVKKYDVALTSYSSDTFGQLTVNPSNQFHKMIMTMTAEEIPAAWEAWLTENDAQIQSILDELNTNITR